VSYIINSLQRRISERLSDPVRPEIREELVALCPVAGLTLKLTFRLHSHLDAMDCGCDRVYEAYAAAVTDRFLAAALHMRG
jgi:hypothetical protein